MSLNFSIANVVYVKNLSANVSEEDIREKFQECDEIISVVFKKFPGTNQKYCQIEFKTSEGITKSSRLNGELLLNLPMTVTVIEPILQSQTSSETANIIEYDKSGNNIDYTSSQYQNLQNILLQNQAISDQKKRLVDFQNELNEKNKKFDVFSKIIYMENIPEKYNESDVVEFFKHVGKTTSYKFQYNEQINMYTAYVEFINEENAKAALNLSGTKIEDKEIIIKDAYSILNQNDSSLKTQLSIYNNLNKKLNSDQNIINKQSNVNEKVEKVLALKEKLALKLCAMYNPNLLLVNNLVQANQLLLTNSLDSTSNNNNINKEKEKNESDLATSQKGLKHGNKRSDEDTSDDERKKYIKKKRKKSTRYSSNSRSSHESEESDENKSDERSSKSGSSSGSSSRSSSGGRKKNIDKRRNSRKRDKIKKRSSSSSSNYTKSDSSSSYDSGKHTDRHKYRSQRHKKKRRKTSKGGYDSSDTYSDSSHSSKRKHRKSSSDKPWWIQESEKMEMRKRMKEKYRREMLYRHREREKSRYRHRDRDRDRDRR
ncbi:RNA-binding protein, putative [Plasmodium vinckei brucechwatti]|uniref:RNA-binding protein, putative n=1 Tax=Plasmodium vinckei brucechwatti TaxID=119398 RepID=A0A6V7RTW0_PLAVN|nr:RNA-binding protein, putative [Plasmodium vinckei brucechwatti]